MSKPTKDNPLGLAPFEGSAIGRTSAKVGNAGQALSEVMKFDPDAWAISDTVYIVLQCDVVDVHFPSIVGEEDKRNRQHILRATDAAVVTPDIADEVQEIVNAARLKVQIGRAKAKGQDPFEGMDPSA